MLGPDTGGFAATTASRGFDIEDFVNTGVRVVERRFKARDVIFTPGDPDDQLYFLLEGTVRLYEIYGDYKDATATLLRDDGVFGKLSLVEGRWQDVFAEAVTDVRVGGVQKSALIEVIKRRPDFAMKLFSRDEPAAPGLGEHDRLDSRGRLQGDEQVPTRRHHRDPGPQDSPRGQGSLRRTRLGSLRLGCGRPAIDLNDRFYKRPAYCSTPRLAHGV